MFRRLILAHLALGLPTIALAQSETPQPPRDPAAMFARVDANKDGAVTLEEWLAIGRREMGFKLIDADRDGKMTPVEFSEGIAKFRAYAKPR